MNPRGPDPQDQPAGSEPPASPPRQDAGPGIVIGRPLGIPVYVSPYWFLFAALIVIFYAGLLKDSVSGSTTRYLVAAAFVVLLYLSVLIHELSHCVVARAFSLPGLFQQPATLARVGMPAQYSESPIDLFGHNGTGQFMRHSHRGQRYQEVGSFPPRRRQTIVPAHDKDQIMPQHFPFGE